MASLETLRTHVFCYVIIAHRLDLVDFMELRYLRKIKHDFRLESPFLPLLVFSILNRLEFQVMSCEVFN